MSHHVLRCVLAACLAVLLLADRSIGEDAGLTFEKRIRPILAAKCFKCHSHERRKGELELSSLTALVDGGESGPVVVAGHPEKSLLIELISDGEMPSEGEPPLTPKEIETISRWITDGVEIRKYASKQPVTQHNIIPLMLLRCTVCHGARRREADLDLRTVEGMLKGGKSGPGLVPGKPDESLIIQRIRAEEMPPRRKLVEVSVKPMEDAELTVLSAWVADGMPMSERTPDLASRQPDPLVTDEDRQFWSFQPPKSVAPPVDKVHADDLARAQNPIDIFIAARLREQGMAPSQQADRATLIRRLHVDLLGLLPTPADVNAFVDDPSPKAYETLVDRLLASPRYGERWGRHWLDVAGYADSEGAQNEDRVRPNMWRYRDYVVRAFNADKPYDRLLMEQLAGDELDDYENAARITDEIYDNLAATGFLRTAPDRTFAGITNFVPDRLELIADEIQILASSVLGLTLHCSRCHSHKFDPLPQRDYYRLAAALKDALDEHDWLKPEDRTLGYVTTAERTAWQEREQAITDRLAPLKNRFEAEKDEEAKKQLEKQIKEIEATRRPEPRIRALWSRGEPSPTYILKRGNYLTPGREVGPGVPAVLSGKRPFEVQSPRPGAKTTGRRLALARWITQRDHPLTARVLVNRIWEHHFGRGIVTTPSNFGRAGTPPSHPQLLDWLAVEFVRKDWSIKAMHRLMVTSRTYRQTSRVTDELLSADPENKWFSRMPLRRMEAEVLRDSLLFVAGQLTETPFGPPDDVDVREDGLVTSRRGHSGWRRSVYVQHRRTKMPTILENFDSPQMGPNCVQRDVSIVAPQALHLLNNKMIYELAGNFADRIIHEVGNNPGTQVNRVHAIAFGRQPSDAEKELAMETLAGLTDKWLETLKPNATADDAARRALTNYCHAVMNSAAFLYVD